MKEKTVNIIGSGIGGLMSGALLAKHGFKVTVFEALPHIGGYTSSWKRGDYTFEASIHELNGFFPDDKKLRMFRYLGLFDRVKLLPIPSPYTSVFSDYEFRVPHDYEEYIAKLISEFPDEEKGIRSVMAAIKEISVSCMGFLGEESMIKGFLNVPQKYPALMKYTFNTLYDLLWKKLKSPKLRTIIGQLYNYYADDVKKLCALYYGSPTYSFLNEAYWMSGSSSELSGALRDIIEENGGKVLTKSRVSKIIFAGKKAVGVELEKDGSQHMAELTICNSALKPTVEKLIGRKNMPGMLYRKAVKAKPSTSIFALYLGLKADTKDLGMEDYCYVLNELEDLSLLHENGKHVEHAKRPITIVSYNFDDSLAPKGKTVACACITDRIGYWEQFEGDRAAYKKEKERIAEQVLDRIERRFPGFKDAVEVMDIGTPATMRRFSGNPGGEVYGAAQTIWQQNIFRFPNEIKGRNLYFASAWVNPGGGVSGSLLSSIAVVESILKSSNITNRIDEHIMPLPVAGDNRPESCK